MPLNALNAAFVRNLQEKYPDAQVTISPSVTMSAEKMKPDTFGILLSSLIGEESVRRI